MLRNPVSPDLLDLMDTGSPGDIDFYCEYARYGGGPVLVLLSGTGRVAIPMARQGIPVMGVDADAGIVDLAKRKAQQLGVTRVMFAQGDVTRVATDRQYGLVAIPGGALSRLLTLNEQRACLSAARHALGIGGKLVLDVVIGDPLTQVSDMPAVRWTGVAGDQGAVLIRRRRYDPALQLIEEFVTCDWINQAGQVERIEHGILTTRYSTPGEIILLLESCGFTVSVFGGFDRQDVLPGTSHLVVEAQRRL